MRVSSSSKSTVFVAVAAVAAILLTDLSTSTPWICTGHQERHNRQYMKTVDKAVADMVRNTVAGVEYRVEYKESRPPVYGRSYCTDSETCRSDLDYASDELSVNCAHYVGTAFESLGVAYLHYTNTPPNHN